MRGFYNAHNAGKQAQEDILKGKYPNKNIKASKNKETTSVVTDKNGNKTRETTFDFGDAKVIIVEDEVKKKVVSGSRVEVKP